MGVASFEGSGAALVDFRVRVVVVCLRGVGLGAAGSLVETLERVERFATAATLADDLLAGVDLLVGASAGDGVGRPAGDSRSGISLVPERVVRDFVVVVVGAAVVVVVLVVAAEVDFTVALGAEGGLRRRIGRGIGVVLCLLAKIGVYRWR